jgi:tetraacyldisaccharide 4'-kinase
LWPLALVFRVLIVLRASLYRAGVLRAQHVGVPVIVIGNLTVGGTGKTPVAQWVARQLTVRGRRVGIVLRGYGGSHHGGPRVVTAADAAAVVGDEAVLHAQQEGHVVAIGADRVAAARLAVEQGAEVIVCDDGLQHVRLARDYEIAVVDGARGLGNGWLLPAGPLREPARRLESVHAVVLTDRGGTRPLQTLNLRRPLQVTARFAPGHAVNLLTGEKRPLQQFAGVSPLHAIAGIGNPAAFFAALREHGLDVQTHALPDHAALDPAALSLPQDAIVLMTAKDAVKCAGIARPGWWWVDLDLEMSRADAAILLDSLLARTGLTGAGVALG